MQRRGSMFVTLSALVNVASRSSRSRRQGGPGVNPAPGYDPVLPHDLQHFIVERALGIEGAVFGQLAAGGTAGTFHVIAIDGALGAGEKHAGVPVGKPSSRSNEMMPIGGGCDADGDHVRGGRCASNRFGGHLVGRRRSRISRGQEPFWCSLPAGRVETARLEICSSLPSQETSSMRC